MYSNMVESLKKLIHALVYFLWILVTFLAWAFWCNRSCKLYLVNLLQQAKADLAVLLCCRYICNIKIQYLDTAFKGEPEGKMACAYSEPLFCFAGTCNRDGGFLLQGSQEHFALLSTYYFYSQRWLQVFDLHLGVANLVCLGATGHESSCRRTYAFFLASFILLADTVMYPNILIDSGCEYEAGLPPCTPSHPESVQTCFFACLLAICVLSTPIGRWLVTTHVARKANASHRQFRAISCRGFTGFFSYVCCWLRLLREILSPIGLEKNFHFTSNH